MVVHVYMHVCYIMCCRWYETLYVHTRTKSQYYIIYTNILGEYRQTVRQTDCSCSTSTVGIIVATISTLLVTVITIAGICFTMQIWYKLVNKRKIQRYSFLTSYDILA